MKHHTPHKPHSIPLLDPDDAEPGLLPIEPEWTHGNSVWCMSHVPCVGASVRQCVGARPRAEATAKATLWRWWPSAQGSYLALITFRLRTLRAS